MRRAPSSPPLIERRRPVDPDGHLREQQAAGHTRWYTNRLHRQGVIDGATRDAIIHALPVRPDIPPHPRSRADQHARSRSR